MKGLVIIEGAARGSELASAAEAFRTQAALAGDEVTEVVVDDPTKGNAPELEALGFGSAASLSAALDYVVGIIPSQLVDPPPEFPPGEFTQAPAPEVTADGPGVPAFFLGSSFAVKFVDGVTKTVIFGPSVGTDDALRSIWQFRGELGAPGLASTHVLVSRLLDVIGALLAEREALTDALAAALGDRDSAEAHVAIVEAADGQLREAQRIENVASRREFIKSMAKIAGTAVVPLAVAKLTVDAQHDNQQMQARTTMFQHVLDENPSDGGRSPEEMQELVDQALELSEQIENG